MRRITTTAALAAGLLFGATGAAEAATLTHAVGWRPLAGGGQVRVDVALLVPPGQRPAHVRRAALRSLHLRRAPTRRQFAYTPIPGGTWADAHVTQQYNPAGAAVPDGAALLQQAQQAWTGLGTASFRFDYGGLTSRCPSLLLHPCGGTTDGHDDVGWGDLQAPGAAGLTGTAYVNGHAIESDVVLQQPLPPPFHWGDACTPGASATSGTVQPLDVLIHEDGHVLGLDHSKDPAAIMFPSETTQTFCAPQPDDIAGVSALYPTYPAKLKVRRAGVKHGRLDVLAEITKRADGDEVRVDYYAQKRHDRFTVTAKDGRLEFKHRLRGRQRRGRTGILTFTYPGSDLVWPAEVRLRAANRKARLKRGDITLRDGRLSVDGRISRRARGHVRLALSYPQADGTIGTWDGEARIHRGRWSLSAQLPPAAAQGGYLTIQFTGYLARHMRGEQDAKQVTATG